MMTLNDVADRPAKRQRVTNDHGSPKLLESIRREQTPNYRVCFGSVGRNPIPNSE